MHHVLRKLIHAGETNIRELQNLTGRSPSTIYRWLNADAEPSWLDVQRMVIGLRSGEAQREILRIFTSELPVTVMWKQVEPATPPPDPDQPPTDEIDLTLAAVNTATELLRFQRDLVMKGRVSPESYQELAARVDKAINCLLASRELSLKRVRSRKNAVR